MKRLLYKLLFIIFNIIAVPISILLTLVCMILDTFWFFTIIDFLFDCKDSGDYAIGLILFFCNISERIIKGFKKAER